MPLPIITKRAFVLILTSPLLECVGLHTPHPYAWTEPTQPTLTNLISAICLACLFNRTEHLDYLLNTGYMPVLLTHPKLLTFKTKYLLAGVHRRVFNAQYWRVWGCKCPVLVHTLTRATC